jgi:flagellin
LRPNYCDASAIDGQKAGASYVELARCQQRVAPALTADTMSRISTGIHGVDQQFLQTFRRNSDRLQVSLERLTTGKRINRPSDDPPGFIAAEGFRRELADLKAKVKDISRERSQSHIRQSELSSIQDAFADLRDKLITAADGFLSADQRAALEAELDEAVAALGRISEVTEQLSATTVRDYFPAPPLSSADVATVEMVDARSDEVLRERAALAAREHTQLNVFEQLYEDQIVIVSEALSQIEDTDFAAEAANFAQSQILSQGAMAALSYANRQRAEQLAQLLDEVA